MKHFATRKDLIASFAKDTVGVEVGVQAGIFSQEILDCGVKHLHLVDPWEHQKGEYEKDPANIDQGGQDALYRSVVEKFKGDTRVKIHRLYCGQVYPYLLNRHQSHVRASWVYLDSSHLLMDVFSQLVQFNSFTEFTRILGHDYTDSPEAQAMGFGVVKAVDQFCRDFDWEMTAITDETWPSYLLERK